MRKISICILSIFLLVACNSSKKATTSVSTETKSEKKEVKIPEPANYQASNKRTNDVVHVKLDVSFDWDKKYMYGQEWITCKAHFYPVNHLDLNAKGMEIKAVVMMKDKVPQNKLNYVYENDSLKIDLDRTYTRDENYTLFIDYIAKPDELKETGGSAAISSDKGLYFINADGKNPKKPKQIWTQGETQSNQVWMPIIDSPNQRMTQEINITVDDKFVTLSNGLLTSSEQLPGGKRVDHWKQTLGAAPYLSMMAISNFKVVKDKWRNIDVNYYVDPEFEQYAKAIFGNTPQMLEFFSTRLGVDYAWEKFSQVVVHDYVSGAMENTSAVLHGEFLQRTARELLDATNEDVVSHELFHQWFGDLVTCESWSNIPLNESFATYGEYLWNENKYGRDKADHGLMEDLNVYMQQAKVNDANLVRFNYKEREELFDGITYQKGGRILHMLRKYVGDEAFFASLKKYLTDNKFKPVEVHNLRLAFEDVTGEDLNWFFNQWFYNKGFPDLEISYSYNDTLKNAIVTVNQKQNFESSQLFKLPVDIDIYINNKIIRKHVIIESASENFVFDVPSKPDLVNFDAEKMLLCTKTDNHTNDEWVFMFNHAPLLLDRNESLKKLSKTYEASNEKVKNILMSALNDKYYSIRSQAIKNIGTLAKSESDKAPIKTKLMELATKDIKASVRADALTALAKNYDDADLLTLYQGATKDSSYNVMSTGIEKYADKNPKEALIFVKQFENETNEEVVATVAGIYADKGSDEQNDYFMKQFDAVTGFGAYSLIQTYETFLAKCKSETINIGKDKLTNIARNGTPWWMKMTAMQALTSLSGELDSRLKKLTGPENMTEESKTRKTKESLDSAIADIKKNEKEKRLSKIYSSGGN